MSTELELQDLGILRVARLPEHLSWLTDGEKILLLQLLLSGEEGLHKRNVKKHEKLYPDAVIKLEAYDLARWERDKVGRPMFFCLTWKGQDAAEIVKVVARRENQKTTSGGTSC